MIIAIVSVVLLLLIYSLCKISTESDKIDNYRLSHELTLNLKWNYYPTTHPIKDGYYLVKLDTSEIYITKYIASEGKFDIDKVVEWTPIGD